MSPECSSCHEAGHSVAWTANGDNVLLVVGRKGATTSPEQEELLRKSTIGNDPTDSAVLDYCVKRMRSGGVTIASVGDHSCRCGGTIKSISLDPVKAAYKLDYECDGCMKLLTDHLACMFAGGAATSQILPREHRASQSEDDYKTIDSILTLVKNEQKRRLLRDQAEKRAQDLVRRHSEVVAAVSEVLIERDVLDAVEAKRIIGSQLRMSPG